MHVHINGVHNRQQIPELCDCETYCVAPVYGSEYL